MSVFLPRCLHSSGCRRSPARLSSRWSLRIALLALGVAASTVTVRANMASNPGFEAGSGDDADGWARWDQLFRRDWAWETGSWGIGFEGWWGTGGGGGIFQDIGTERFNADTNVLYYFRARMRVEPEFTDRTFEQKVEFLDSGWVLQGSAVNYANSSGWSDWTWTTVTMTAAPPGPYSHVRIVWYSPGTSIVGYGSQGAELDRVMVWDKTLRYLPGEIVEEFSYDPDFTNQLAGKDSGNGFSGPWQESNNGAFTINDGSFGSLTGYPTNRGMKVLFAPNNGEQQTASRSFPAVNSGTIYAAGFLNYQYSGADKWAGFSFLSNGTERAFFGEIAGADQALGLSSYAADSSCVTSSYALTAGDGNDYLVLASYTFATRVLRTKAYYKTDTLPATEPAVWDAVVTTAVGRILSIDGIRLGAGGPVDATPGACYYDEIRVASTWSGLRNQTANEPPGLSATPGSLSFTAMKGDAPSGNFSVANVGGSVLYYTNYVSYGSGSGWLDVSPADASLASGASQNEAATANTTSLAAGSYSATVTVHGNETNAAAPTVAVSLSVSNIPSVQSVTATPDGPQLVRLTAAERGGRQMLVVYRAAAAPSADPVDGTPYSPGDSLGGGTVLFTITGSTTVSNLDHVVPSGTVGFYKFYAVHNNAYSPGVLVGATNSAYEAWELVEPAAYTNGANLANCNGGTGWDSSWGPGTQYVVALGSLAVPVHYPTAHGNKLLLPDTGINHGADRPRSFPTISTGRVYLAYSMSVGNNGDGTYCGIQFMLDGATKLFIGMRGNSTVLGLENSVDSSGAYSPYIITPGADNVHTFLARYDFSTRELVAVGRYKTDTVPVDEPTSWDVSLTIPADQVTAINGINLNIGSFGDHNIGEVYIDEIRVAQSWATLINQAPAPGLAVGPTALSFQTMLGNDATGNVFAVTNVGIGTLSYTNYATYGDGASGWLTVDPAVNALAEGVAQIHNATIASAGFTGAGVYVATNRVDGNQTNSAKQVVVTLTVTNIPNPTGFTVTPDGAEMTRLSWSSPFDVLLVYRGGAAPTADPINGTPYAPGDAVGGGVVLYSGSGSSLEHCGLTNGASQYYRIYAINNAHYSTGAFSSASTLTYEPGVIAEPVAYTNGSYLTGRDGGQGWTAAWGGPTDLQIAYGSLETPTFYPAPHGNKIFLPDTGPDRGIDRPRSFPMISTGRVYLSYAISVGNSGDGTYAGVQFMSNGVARLFVGMPGGSTVMGVQNSIDYGGAFSSYVLSTGTNNVHTFLARYDFSTRELSAIGVYKTGSVPLDEPTSWDVTYTVPADYANGVDAINFNIGCYSGHDIGEVYLDEIRVAQSWTDLLKAKPVMAIGPQTLSLQTMLGSDSTGHVFAVTNTGTATLSYTNYQTYGATASGWLSVTPAAFDLGSGLTRVHTGVVAGTVFTNTGVFVATNRVDGNQTNVAQQVVVTVTVTNIPAPTGFTVSADGAEMTRLAWDSAFSNVLVVYRAGSAPSANPTNGTAYQVGDSLGGGVVIAKTTVAGGQSLEHVGLANGSAHYYALYAINNDRYSTGAVQSATTLTYRPWEVVEPMAYTNGAGSPVNGQNGGQGWVDAWSGSSAIQVGSGNLETPANYPTSHGNKMFLPDPGPDSGANMLRSFTAINTGRIYMSYVVSPGAHGPGRYCGLQLTSNGVTRLFVGMRGGSTVLGVENSIDYGGAYSSYVLTPGSNNVHTIIARYDFTTHEFSALGVYKSGTVPMHEPDTWDVTYAVPPDYAESIDGVNLNLGGYGGESIGNTYLDEIRVAHSWTALLNAVAPVATNYSVNGGAAVGDGQVASGAYSVTMRFYDPDGMTNSATSPNYDLLNPGAVVVITNLAFASATYADLGRSLLGSNTAQTAVAPEGVQLGTYSLRWSAASSNGAETTDATTLSNGVTALTFTVTDDDTSAPIASGFNVSGAIYTNVDLGGGLLVTGQLQDAGSGVFGGSSNRYVLYRNGSQVDSGTFTVAPASDGDALAAPAALEVTLAGAVVDTPASYQFIVFSRDYDIDRTGDTLAGSNSFSFTVVSFDCPSGVPPALTQPGNKTVFVDNNLSFTITASETTPCPAPALAASELPSGASFNSATSGSSRTGTFSWTPNGGQAGTYPIRFTSTDGESLSTSLILRVYVAQAAEPTNSAGVPVSQTNWAVSITNIDIPASGNVTVVWESVDGVAYDVYQSDNNFGGAMSWSRVVSETVADAPEESAGVAAGVSQRYFQVTLTGSAPTSNGVWGVVRPTVQPATFTLMSAGLNGDRAFNGALGSNLAAVLTGYDDGAGDNHGDEIFLMEPNQAWRNLYLDASGLWRESSGDATTYALNPGQGFYVLRNSGSAAQPRLTGPVGNTGIATNTLAAEWNIIGLSQGRHLPISQAFTNLAQGAPTANWDETAADLVVVQNSNGSWRRIMRAGDGTWFDLSTFGTATINFGPGTAVYYYRQAGSGQMKVRF